jgi:hypothetical protein
VARSRVRGFRQISQLQLSAPGVPRGNKFNGQIHWVQIDIGTDDHDHLIAPEERFKVAMARQ